jgi:sporulation protein YlmC with PRC-barrel domain
MQLALGHPVRCRDGTFGELNDLVIDPTTRRVTHLVVLPSGQRTGARLVPVEQVEPRNGGSIALRCSRADVHSMDAVDEVAFLRLHEFAVDDPDWDVGVSSMYALPYYESLEGIGPARLDPDPQVMMGYDRIPKGDVEIRRSSPVTASDGHHLGHVEGFVVDDQQRIAELVLEHGHLWGRRDVTVPIGAVDRIENDTVVLRMTKDEVGALGQRRVRRWAAD